MTVHPHQLVVAPRTTARARRIGLLGLFGVGNLGNDGSAEAVLLFLRRALPDAEIVCICPQLSKIGHSLAVPTLPLSGSRGSGRWFAILDRLLAGAPRGVAAAVRAVRDLRKFDAVIVPGTGALDDFATGPRGWPVALFIWCAAARLRGARLLFVSIGAGPIAHPLSRWLMKSAARLAHYRSYRDTLSKDYMTSIGFDTGGDAVYPDVAFRLPAPSAPAGPPPAASSEDRGALTVGLGLMTYFGWRGDWERGAAIYAGYLRKITHFALWLLDHGHRVRILMGEDSDQKAIDDVTRAIAAERPGYPQDRLIAEPSHSLHELMRQMGETHLVVGTRFHNIVCALKLGKPIISVGYARKNDVLMADMGLEDFCQHVERLDVDLLIDQFSRLAANRAAYERSIREKAAEYTRRLADQERILLERVLR
jgi:polysaccharide pyruvyl transferase WcaK-like protein